MITIKEAIGDGITEIGTEIMTETDRDMIETGTETGGATEIETTTEGIDEEEIDLLDDQGIGQGHPIVVIGTGIELQTGNNDCVNF